MNPDENEPPPTPAEPPILSIPVLPTVDWRYWARRLLVCNPFFLCSAALLLFGVNRLSLDPNFLGEEGANLLFNYSALQLYGVLVVGTALVLARRKIWYDSVLLVVVENGLVLVPFLLISQGALMKTHLGVTLALGAVLLAAGRALAIRRWYPRFNLPPRALALGAVVLLINAALPLIYPPAVEMDTGDWATPNLWLWFVVLPALAAGANFLPKPRPHGGLNPERPWLPLFIFALWVAATGAHFWCLGHISDLAFQIAWLAPAVLIAAWTMYARLEDSLASPGLRARGTILVLAFCAPLLASSKPWLFELLVFINAVGFGALFLRATDVRSVARELVVLSLPLTALCLPEEIGRILVPFFTRDAGLTLSLAVLLVVCGLRWFRPLAGYTGALGMMALVALGWPGAPLHAYVQAALLFLLTHSLAWNKPSPGAQFIRAAAGVLWLMNAAVWVHDYPWRTDLGVTLSALLLLATWFAIWRVSGKRPSLLLASSAVAVSVCAPGDWLIRYGSPGVIALTASVFLFATGFLVAWTRHHWESNEARR